MHENMNNCDVILTIFSVIFLWTHSLTEIYDIKYLSDKISRSSEAKYCSIVCVRLTCRTIATMIITALHINTSSGPDSAFVSFKIANLCCPGVVGKAESGV